jgi:hypothetical protein
MMGFSLVKRISETTPGEELQLSIKMPLRFVIRDVRYAVVLAFWFRWLWSAHTAKKQTLPE